MPARTSNKIQKYKLKNLFLRIDKEIFFQAAWRIPLRIVPHDIHGGLINKYKCYSYRSALFGNFALHKHI